MSNLAPNNVNVRTTVPSKVSRLPICDLLFCFVSLILLIAETICIVLTILYFYNFGEFLSYFAIIVAVYAFGSLAVNGLSIFWYLKTESQTFRSVDLGLHLCLHVFQLSLFWRYIILLRRIRLDTAKLLICELCSLRAMHSVLISSISCFFLLFFIFKNWYDVPILISTTCFLCFCDFCWGLASFSRKCRRDRAENLILCWPGILAQFFWRLGTIGARVTALVVYTRAYSYYVVVVVILHWLLMVLGLVLVFPSIKPDQTRKNLLKRVGFGLFLAAFYVVFFFNPSKQKTKFRFACFYCVMFAENSLLAAVSISWSMSVDRTWTTMHTFVAVFVWFGFFFGIFWMILYYRYLHASVLSAKLLASTINASELRNSRQQRSNPIVFACTAQLPFKKQPSKFRVPPPAPIAQSASASSMTLTTKAIVELSERRSRSVPAVHRKQHRQRSRDDELDNSVMVDVYAANNDRPPNSNSYPKRYHETRRVATLSSANANAFRRNTEWSDSSDELSRTLSNSIKKTKRSRPTSVGSIILRTMDDDQGRKRIETVF